MAGRTWLQQALPTTFGLKAAGWLDAVTRDRERLGAARRRVLVLQFGGAVGTLAALGSRGAEVAAALASALHLRLPELPWHAHRDRIAEIGGVLGICTGTLGKIARDLALSAQTEIGELGEPEADGRGGSSTLPHKRNPVASAIALSAAARVPGLVATLLGAMDQEHERGLGGWHAEWETLPEIVALSGGALHHLTDAVCGLRVDAVRMRANLEATQGAIFAEAVQMALGSSLGRAEAHERVASACRKARAERRHLREVLTADETIARLLSAADLERLFDPAGYLGEAGRFVDRVLAAHAAGRGRE
jgi:3-carboxy-cis,cis-muconate cycloisomerase